MLSYLRHLWDFFQNIAKTGDASKILAAFVAGTAFGLFIKAFDQSQLKFDFTITPFYAFVGVIVIAILLFAIAAAMANNEKKADQLGGTAGVGLFLLIMVLLFGHVIPSACSSLTRGNSFERLEVGEMLYLSEKASAINDFDKAIMWLERAERMLPDTDARKKALTDKIIDMKRAQIR